MWSVRETIHCVWLKDFAAYKVSQWLVWFDPDTSNWLGSGGTLPSLSEDIYAPKSGNANPSRGRAGILTKPLISGASGSQGVIHRPLEIPKVKTIFIIVRGHIWDLHSCRLTWWAQAVEVELLVPPWESLGIPGNPGTTLMESVCSSWSCSCSEKRKVYFHLMMPMIKQWKLPVCLHINP